MSQIEDNQTAAGSVDDIVNFNLIFPLLQSYPVKFLTTCDTMDAFTAGPCFFKSCCQLLVVTDTKGTEEDECQRGNTEQFQILLKAGPTR